MFREEPRWRCDHQLRGTFYTGSNRNKRFSYTNRDELTRFAIFAVIIDDRALFQSQIH